MHGCVSPALAQSLRMGVRAREACIYQSIDPSASVAWRRYSGAPGLRGRGRRGRNRPDDKTWECTGVRPRRAPIPPPGRPSQPRPAGKLLERDCEREDRCNSSNSHETRARACVRAVAVNQTLPACCQKKKKTKLCPPA
jgi:hypothetical protein